MNDDVSTFTFNKRQFLHKQLDEILRLWYRASGQGTFFFSVSDGNPNFQYGIQLDFNDDVSVPEYTQRPHQQFRHPGHDGVRARRRGPARQARDRARAAKFQAAQSAAAVKAAKSSTLTSTPSQRTFPGVGKAVGRADKPILPVPLQNGVFFPPPITTNTASVAAFSPPSVTSLMGFPTTTSTQVVSTVAMARSTLCTTYTTATPVVSLGIPSSNSNIQSLSTPLLHRHPSVCRDEILSDEEEDEELNEKSCGHCLSMFGSDSKFGYCPLCYKAFHKSCAQGHKCVNNFK